jgi:nitroimidazol reductase NimA-like FMN-containing flavoprotein (pyridoxamine 5'-phosphate oxidase superfamily)
MNTSAQMGGQPFEIPAEECRELLGAGLVGRVAVSTPMGPHIVPVNYAVVDDSVILRTSPYSVLGSHARGAILALEIDQFDYTRQRGWSVVARGRADAVTSAEELNHIRHVWEPNAWAAGQRNLYLRVRWSELTGRRLGAGWDPAGDLQVRRVI